MIIWGRRIIYRTVGVKTFFCPNDNSDQSGRVREARRWFTLYFIPINPLEVLGQVVQCTNCRSTYEMSVFSLRTESEFRELKGLRDLASELTQPLDETHADDGLIPFDLDVVEGVGIGIRMPRDLSSTRPFDAQELSETDIEAIHDLAQLIAAGDMAPRVLHSLTAVELRSMSALAELMSGDSQRHSADQIASFSGLQGLVEGELARRPS